MKTDKRTQLLKILSDTSQSISSAALANMLGTSERTVRNYIRAINEEARPLLLPPGRLPSGKPCCQSGCLAQRSRIPRLEGALRSIDQ